jgi:hypothetical protein
VGLAEDLDADQETAEETARELSAMTAPSHDDPRSPADDRQ